MALSQKRDSLVRRVPSTRRGIPIFPFYLMPQPTNKGGARGDRPMPGVWGAPLAHMPKGLTREFLVRGFGGAPQLLILFIFLPSHNVARVGGSRRADQAATQA